MDASDWHNSADEEIGLPTVHRLRRQTWFHWGQQLYHARAEQLGELGLPGCDEALSGMGGASLTNEVPGVM